MSGTPQRRGPQILLAAALVVLAVVLFISAAYVPRQLVDDPGTVIAINLTLRGLALAAVAGAATVLLRARQDEDPS